VIARDGYVPQRHYFRNVFVISPTSLLQQGDFNRFMASLVGETACTHVLIIFINIANQYVLMETGIQVATCPS